MSLLFVGAKKKLFIGKLILIAIQTKIKLMSVNINEPVIFKLNAYPQIFFGK
jgi:hypothetical protein